MTITVGQYLSQHSQGGRNVPNQSVVDNATELIRLLDALCADPDCPIRYPDLRSGWRPPSVNAATPNAAPNSTHMTGNGIDIADNDGVFDDWLTDEILEKYGLYREHPSQTKSWVHLQRVPPKSGKRTYYA